MPVFQYKAINKKGKLVISYVSAEDIGLAAKKLQKSYQHIITIDQKDEKVDIWSYVKRFAEIFKKGVDDQTMAIFYRQLATMLKCGLPVFRSLKIIGDQNDNKKMKELMECVAYDIQRGLSLAFSLSQHPKFFEESSVALITVGQNTGMLVEVLDRLATHTEKELAVKRHIKQALAYPITVFVVLIVAVVLMLIYFVPSFMKIYEDMKMNLPLPTKILLFFTNIWKNPVFDISLIITIVASIYFGMRFLETPFGKLYFDKLKLKIPFFGKLSNAVILSRFCRSLSIMNLTGLPLLKSLELSIGVVENEVYKNILRQTYDSVKEGAFLSDSFKANEFIPKIMSDMVLIGEQTGELSRLLNKVAAMFDNDVMYALDTVLAIIEPVMIASLSLVVGFVMIAIFLPLYGIIQNMGTK